MDYAKPVKRLEIFTFERFEYSSSKYVFSKETKSDDALKLLYNLGTVGSMYRVKQE